MFPINQPRTFSFIFLIIYSISLISCERLSLRVHENEKLEEPNFNKLIAKKFPAADEKQRLSNIGGNLQKSASIKTTDDNNNNNNSSSSSSSLEENEDNNYTANSSSSSSSTGTTNSCSGCKNREDLKYYNKHQLREQILHKMGFTMAPNITGRHLPKIPSHYLQQIEDNELMQSDQAVHGDGGDDDAEDNDDIDDFDDDDRFYIKTKKILTFAEQYPHLRHSWNSDNILYFSFSDIVTKYHVNTSTLNVFIHGSDHRPFSIVLLEIYRIRKLGEHSEPPLLQKVYTSKELQPSGKGRWFKIDFTETVSEWFKNKEANYGFIINATVNGRNVAVTEIDLDSAKIPYVETTVKEPKRRSRRNTGLTCEENENQPLCCRYNFMIDFVDIGLDFIIAPKRFNAGMCAGECPFLTLQKYPHTHLLKMTQPNSAGPCCSPRKMSSMSILYFDDKYSVVYSKFPGMVVDRCGCS